MRLLRHFILLISILFLFSCSGPTKDGRYNRPFLGFNGKYCAEVVFYNPNFNETKTFFTYVEAEEDDLIVLYWPNEIGRIDLDHMSNQVVISRKGLAKFENEEGFRYTVQIVSNECHY